MTTASVSPPLEAIKQAIETALREDAAERDRTSLLLPRAAMMRARLIARSRIVVAGIPVLHSFRTHARITPAAEDGQTVSPGGTIAELDGAARNILSIERVLLNFIAHLSGIATLTHEFKRRIVPGSRVKLLDTRKTTPGLRLLEKYAVRCGGGVNHRFDLSEAIFVKDNHLRIRGFDYYRSALAEIRPLDVPLIVEVDSPDQIPEALTLSPDRILLDNMTDRAIMESSRTIRGHAKKRVEIEVSGGVTLERIPALSRLEIDFISIGSLTHSAPAADLSLEVTGPSRG